MNLATIGMVVIAVTGSLLVGMAALIKSMVVGKLDDLQKGMNEMRSEVHEIDLRVTRLETEYQFISRRAGE